MTKLRRITAQAIRAPREDQRASQQRVDRSEEETVELREATDSAQGIEVELRAAIVLEDEADKNWLVKQAPTPSSASAWRFEAA